MQTSLAAQRISTVAHSTNPILPDIAGQIVVKDSRLRNWQLASSGGLTDANCVRAVLNADGEIVRIRTVDGVYYFDGSLDIRYATPGDTVTWSANTIVADALGGGGVDLFANGNTIDAFWVDADAVTIKTSRSVDGGHTWGVISTVSTRSAQGAGVLIQLCAPAADVLIFTDSTVGEDDESNPLTALYVTCKVAGVWNTPTLWDLGGQPLGVEQMVTLPNGDAFPSNLSGIQLSAGRLEVAFYSNSFRESFEDGIWLQRVANVDTSTATQRLHWARPQELRQTVGIDDDNNSTEAFVAFPRIQEVGEEIWVIALESSKFAGHERYHLAFFRSTDGIHFTDEQYNQGAADPLDISDHIYAYAYDGDTPFLLNDLIFSNLIITPTRTFIVSYDKVFWCPSTVLVGEDNPARELDITALVTSWNVNLPQAPTSASATYNLGRLIKDWNDSDILAAHRGIFIDHEAGYLTNVDDELIPVGRFHIDQVTQNTTIGSKSGTVQCLDNTLLLERWKSDLFWEYSGSQQIALDRFCDLTPFIVAHGSYTTSLAGNLKSGQVKKEDNFRDNVGVLNVEQSDGGMMLVRLRCNRGWDGEHAGIVFQGRGQGDEEDNKRFYAILYNRKNSLRFTLNEAIPRRNENNTKLYKYRNALDSSGEYILTGASYWLMVRAYHGHVMAWFTTDSSGTPDATWTKVIDYVSPASPTNDVLPCRLEWWGLVGTHHRIPSGALGNLRSAGAMQDLSSNGSSPRMVALHVQLGEGASVLRRVNVGLTQENTGQDPMPDARILLVTGTETEPDDITDEDNVLFDREASSLYFGVHDSPRWLGANAKPNPQRVKLDSEQHVWVCVTFTDTLAAGQSYKWASDSTGGYGTGQTKYSDDEGVTWNSFGDANLNLCACIEVEYLGGLVKFSRMYFASSEAPYSYEEVAHQIAAKAGVLDISPDDFVNNSDLNLVAGIYWQPEEYGTIGTLVMDADIALGGTPYARAARFIFGSSTVDIDDSNAFIVEIDYDNQTIEYYGVGNVLLHRSESLQWIPLSFHLQVVNYNGFCYVYLNEAFASMWYNDDFTAPGYVGFDSDGATWTNIRIPDLHQIVDYFNIDSRESALSALQRLVAKPSAGTTARNKFFIRYDGSLRIGSFSRQVQVDEYEGTIIRSSKTETQRYALSVVRQSKNFYADRTNPRMLDTDGRIFDERDSTDASSDIDAYEAASQEFKDALERGESPSLNTIANFAAEREDVIQVINPNDKTSGLFVINSINLNSSAEPPVSKQDLGLRIVLE